MCVCIEGDGERKTDEGRSRQGEHIGGGGRGGNRGPDGSGGTEGKEGDGMREEGRD